ncbi:MAG: hypothetical protein DRJ66_02510 [Thermoprotei archaeon]|nr:MAG: hypothetical protein DRJ66_02510 [Thermoprotei archaeon]RLF20901.1 MAG: hypothetical protein DRZ82_00415 [Thermoprotei archaeon]
MKFHAIVRIQDKELSQILYRALLPEARSQPEGELELKIEDESIIIEMRASKISTLRAMLTSHIRMVASALALLKELP